MAHSFAVTVTGDLNRSLKRASTTITNAGGTFVGNVNSGTFSGKTVAGVVKGKYTVSGNKITVTITDKPFVVPNSTIETKVREYFN